MSELTWLGYGWSVAVADGSVPIEVCCGDYATGPEMLSVEEARKLRDAIDSAINAVTATPCGYRTRTGVPCVLDIGHLEKHASEISEAGNRLRWQQGLYGPTVSEVEQVRP